MPLLPAVFLCGDGHVLVQGGGGDDHPSRSTHRLDSLSVEYTANSFSMSEVMYTPCITLVQVEHMAQLRTAFLCGDVFVLLVAGG